MTTAHLTADAVLLAPDSAGVLHVLLIQRRWAPFKGMWAFPGGHVDDGEDTYDAARRELKEETGVTVDVPLRLVAVYAEPGRDPRGRYATWAYVAVLDTMPSPVAADDASDARWVPAGLALADGLAFDHGQILEDALVLSSRSI